MKILIKNGRVIDPASQRDAVCDVAIAAGRIVSINGMPQAFAPIKVMDALGCIVMPGLVDLAVRVREPGHEHEGMLESEMAAAVAGGVTSLVCPPDTDPVLDEPGLVEMLKMRADTDIGYFGSRMRLNPPLRQQRDRDALRAALADGTVDALVSDHTPVDEDAKTLPFAEAEPGATGLELLLGMALKWQQQDAVPLAALGVVSAEPARVLGGTLGTLQASCGRLAEGGVAGVCVFDPNAHWTVSSQALRSQGKHTPFSGHELPGRVRCTIVGGQFAFEARAGLHA